MSGAVGVDAAHPLGTACARAARRPDAYPGRLHDLVEATISAGLRLRPDLDSRLGRALAAPHDWPDLAFLADCLDIPHTSPGADTSGYAPGLERAAVARDAMRARYAR